MEKKFPDIYPCNLMECIIADGAGENTIENVYRIANYGENNRDAFLGSFLTDIIDGKYNNRDVAIAKQCAQADIGTYSTSLSESEAKAIKTLEMLEKKYDGPILLKGTITPEFGLSMYTRNSASKRISNKYHIDWWLYENADPSPYFTKLIIKEV